MSEDHHHLDLKVKDQKPSSIDTKSKLILNLIFVFVTLLVISYEQLIFLTLFLVMFMFLMRSKISAVLKKAVVPMPLMISLTLLAYFSDLDENILKFGGIQIQYSNLEIALFFLYRSVLIIFFALTMIESEDSFFEVIYALDEMRMPEVLVSVLLVMYRSALDLYVEAKRMIDVRYSRSTYKRWGVNIYTYRILGYMLAGILVRSFIKKDLRKDALYSRNFKGKLYHKSKPYLFNGIMMLWLGSITGIIILIMTGFNFLDLGSKI